MLPTPPHLVIEQFVHDLMGRRAEVLGAMQPVLIDTAVGLADQLSVYLDQRPWARLKIGTATIREGDERAYIFVGIKCGRGPLRVHEVTEGWDMHVTNDPVDLVWMVVARRWRFLDRYRSLFERMFQLVADEMASYLHRKPYAILEPAPDHTVRIVEGLDQTYVVFELDDRSPVKVQETQQRYRLN